MGDGTISVKFGSLAEGESALQTGVSQLNAKLEHLDSQLQPLVKSWSGDAQAAYVAQKQKWTQAATDLNSLLATIKTALGDANTNYQSANNAVRSSWE